MTVKRLGVAGALIGSDLVVGDISIANGHIKAIGLLPRGTGLAIPGFVDPQVNGFAGVDFLTAIPGQVAEAGAALAAPVLSHINPLSSPAASRRRSQRRA